MTGLEAIALHGVGDFVLQTDYIAARMLVAIIAALAIALMLLHPVSAQDAPQPTPTVGGGPQIAVEHKVFLPFVANGNDVKASVSWCPSCSPRR